MRKVRDHRAILPMESIMKPTLHFAFAIVAIVLFILAAFGLGNGRLVPAGLAFLTAAWFIV